MVGATNSPACADHLIRDHKRKHIYPKSGTYPNMAICQHCGDKVALPYTCPRCGLVLCGTCRLPPDHKCEDLETWKSVSPENAAVRLDRRNHPDEWGPRPGYAFIKSHEPYDERNDPRFYPPEEGTIPGSSTDQVQHSPDAKKTSLLSRIWDKLSD